MLDLIFLSFHSPHTLIILHFPHCYKEGGKKMCDTVLMLAQPLRQGQIEGLKDRLNIKMVRLKEEKISLEMRRVVL